MPKFIDLTGRHFGRWFVLRRGDDTAYKHPRFWCRCDCGTERLVTAQTLRKGQSTSCGCYDRDQKRAICIARNTTHGRAKSPEHNIWVGIKTRCLNPNASGYQKYGGKGIKVCERWADSFEAFLADMGPRPSPRHTIDRRDTKGHYEPGNCRWATQKEQQNNRSNNVRYAYDGRNMNIDKWAQHLSVSRNTLRLRLAKGLPPERVFTSERWHRWSAH